MEDPAVKAEKYRKVAESFKWPKVLRPSLIKDDDDKKCSRILPDLDEVERKYQALLTREGIEEEMRMAVSANRFPNKVEAMEKKMAKNKPNKKKKRKIRFRLNGRSGKSSIDAVLAGADAEDCDEETKLFDEDAAEDRPDSCYDALPDNVKEKVLELKLSIIEGEQTYIQELEVLLLQAREVLTWKHYLPRFNRRCISGNIQKLKKHASAMEDPLMAGHTLEIDTLLQLLDDQSDDKLTSTMSVYCENLGELRSIFKQKMRKDSEFFTLLYSSYFQIERTLLPIHRLTLLQSLTKSLLEVLPADKGNRLFCLATSLHNKLSKILSKCYEVTRTVHGSTYMRNIQSLFPFDLRLQSRGSEFFENDLKTATLRMTLKQMTKDADSDEVDIAGLHKLLQRWDLTHGRRDESRAGDDSEDDDDNGSETSRLMSHHESLLDDDRSDTQSLCVESIEMKSLKLELCPPKNGEEVGAEDGRRRRERTTLSRGVSEPTLAVRTDEGQIAGAGRNRNLFKKLIGQFMERRRRARSHGRADSDRFECIELVEFTSSAPSTLKRDWKRRDWSDESSLTLETSFENEPLYQVYSENTDKTVTLDGDESGLKVGESSVFYMTEKTNDDKETDPAKTDMHPAEVKAAKKEDELNRIQMQRVNKAIQRTLWEETDRVQCEGILEKMTKLDLALQESKFEIITSEVSYLKSLNVLVTIFIESKELNSILSQEDKENLFKHVLKVKKASETFLYDVAGEWEDDVFLGGIYCVLENHASTTFRVYIDYCSNQVNLHRTMQRLLIQDNQFVATTKELQDNIECLGYSLDSFLTLPMQRVTRLPLLLQAIQRRLPPDSEERQECTNALESLCKLAQECNEAVRREESDGCDGVPGKQKKLSLDITAKSSSGHKGNPRRWSLFNFRDVKSNG